MENRTKRANKLLMISNDINVLSLGSIVANRQIEYAKSWQEVHIIVLADKSTLRKFGLNSKEISLSDNCFAYTTNSFFKLFSPLSTISLGRFICKGRNITNITCQDPFLTALVGVSLKKEFNIELELQLHTDIGAKYFTYNIANKLRKIIALKYLNYADHLRVVSLRIKKYLVEDLKIDEKIIEVRPINIDVEYIKSAPITIDLHKRYPQFEKIVLMASRIEKEKNIELAINAWSKLNNKVLNAGLIIVGDGTLKNELKLLVTRLELDESVIFEKWADRDTLISYYKSADIFLLTSYFEGYGMTLIEAHSAGCKIVSTDVGIAREVGAEIVDWDEENINSVLYDLIKHL